MASKKHTPETLSKITHSHELQRRQQRLTELGQLLSLTDENTLTRAQRSRVDDARSRLEYRKAELVQEFAIREADLKIAIMEEVFNIFKNKNEQTN